MASSFTSEINFVEGRFGAPASDRVKVWSFGRVKVSASDMVKVWSFGRVKEMRLCQGFHLGHNYS